MDLRFCSPSEAAAGFAARSQTLTALAETHHDRKSRAWATHLLQGEMQGRRGQRTASTLDQAIPDEKGAAIATAIARLFAIKRLNNHQFGA